MRSVGIFEAKTRLSEICEEVAKSGHGVVVTRRGKPLVRIEPVVEEGLSVWEARDEYIARYTAQLSYINTLVLDTIDAILTNSETPPVIILQSDHGPGAYFDWESMNNTYLPERLGILNAYYFPDGIYANLYPSITPVNSFRVVLDQFFGTQLGLLEDQSYFSTFDEPYDFNEVTEELNQ